MRIFHRIDDIQIYNEKMKEILDYFEHNTKEFILAIVPKNFDSRYVEIINSYKNCTVYQHGYEHVNHVDKGWCDEFPDTKEEMQRFNLLLKGKKTLENALGYPINGYVPPWNNTGTDTIDILLQLGFSIYSAQENNTVEYLNNKDISVDIIDVYTPEIIYRDLELVYQEICEMSANKDEIGIMYHFRNTKKEDWDLIKNFIQRIEKLGTK